ncbi:MAG: hypothetical protein L3K01_00250 [Thermoplasmata archaeon]|jgi:hypothetical protein|nr:hypothetical protein [Thermoplasmata archaeon]MCI4332155.1 hypothetical protein [Thermoplasmata archaeon]
MGRTVPTYRQALEERMKRWDAFGRLLTTPEEREAFRSLVTAARRYAAQATYVGSPDLLESIVLAILLDLAVRMPKSGPIDAAAARRAS